MRTDIKEIKEQLDKFRDFQVKIKLGEIAQSVRKKLNELIEPDGYKIGMDADKCRIYVIFRRDGSKEEAQEMADYVLNHLNDEYYHVYRKNILEFGNFYGNGFWLDITEK